MTCGKPVEYTSYDFLEGVARRNELSMHPEPEVAMVFKKTTDDQSVDLIEVEKLLRKLLTKVSEHLCIVLVCMYMGTILYWYCLCFVFGYCSKVFFHTYNVHVK